MALLLLSVIFPLLNLVVQIEPSANQIMHLVQEGDAKRAQMLQGYVVTREYRVENKRWNKNAEMVVRLRYRRPDSKEFEVISETGSATIRNKVLKRVLETETETARETPKSDHALNSTNYTFQMAGEGVLRGRPVYIVSATPNRKDELLFSGNVYVDKADFAVARVEGQAAKSPSFWITRLTFVRDYQKIGDLWLPAGDTSIAHVRVFGQTESSVKVGDYQLVTADASK
jgi:hypothetical protein